MALRYTTVQGFWKFMGINESIMSFQPGGKPCRETVASSPVGAGDYYLDQLGANEDTLKLYAGSTQLTETTHYTFDSDTSKVTITSTGETALDGEDLTAEYEYSQMGGALNYNETVRILQSSEDRLHREVGTVFADQSVDSPEYLQVVNEQKVGGGLKYVHYDTDYYPIIKLQTTTDGDYTTGGVEIDLVDASGLPSSGTIYIGGNKVEYSNRSGNTLTIPSSTPSISNGAVVRGEVVEVDTSASGTAQSFIVVTPGSGYEIDYETGKVQLQDSYYTYNDSSIIPENTGHPPMGVDNRVRLSYMTAWREPSRDATIPEEIEEIVYNMAGRNLLQRTILKANTGQRDNFSPGVLQQMTDYVENQLIKYRQINARNA
jgi:hypothetical protein